MLLPLLIGAIAIEDANSTSLHKIAEEKRVFRAISDIASRTCESPQTEGWVWNANGKAGANVDVDRLKRFLGAAGISLDGGAGYSRWRGGLQRDVGSALASRNDCAAKVFVAMIGHLPIVDGKTGKPIQKPSHPFQTFRSIGSRQTQTLGSLVAPSENIVSGQQMNVSAPSTNIQVGGPSANGGPAIQYNYYPPVTADQKTQAHDALVADLTELARYPERGVSDPGPSIVQRHFRFKISRALYVLLSKYNFPTISSVSGGENLNQFVSQYYLLENSAPGFEQIAIEKIGAQVPQKMPIMWSALYEYCLNRALNFTPEQIKNSNGQPNFGITSEEEESLYQKLKIDPQIGPGLSSEANSVDAFTRVARELLKPFQ